MINQVTEDDKSFRCTGCLQRPGDPSFVGMTGKLRDDRKADVHGGDVVGRVFIRGMTSNLVRMAASWLRVKPCERSAPIGLSQMTIDAHAPTTYGSRSSH